MLKPAFQEACRAACETLARETGDGGPAVLVGLPWVEDGALYNAAALLKGGRIEAVRFKVDLPNYGVFDEKRVFRPGPHPGPIAFNGVRIGVPICEDIWGPDPVECIARDGRRDPARAQRKPLRARQARHPPQDRRGARGRVRPAARLSQLRRRAGRTGVRRRLLRLNADGSLAAQLPGFRETVARTVWAREGGGWRCVEGPRETLLPGRRGRLRRLRAGPARLCRRNRFPGVVLGLSGGVDSALCAAMAVDALGAERVHAVMLPYKYTSAASLSDAEACARALGLRYDIVADRRTRRGDGAGARAACSPIVRATSPKRTSRAARAASS